MFVWWHDRGVVGGVARGCIRPRAMTLRWPLTGRVEEMAFVAASLASPAVGGIVVSAPPGVGKSRVAREAIAALPPERHVTRWAVGTSSAAAIPLGAFTSWAVDADDRMQLLRGVIDGLTASDRGRTAIICVDDAHLLDDLSVFVLQQIVARRAAKLILVLRAGAPTPPGLADVWRIGEFERLDLQPFSRADTRRAVCAAIGGELDDDAADRLWQLTRGNVLYLRNIVEQEVHDGRLMDVRGTWHWAGLPVIPPSLVELIEARIGTLSPAVGDVIDVLAVGEPIELSTLRRIVDAAAIEEAEERGLITCDGDTGRVEARVAHPLYGEVRRNRAATTRLRRLRGRLVDELARVAERDELQLVMRRAALALESDVDVDPELFTSAAEGAVHVSDLLLAERFSTAAIRAGGGCEAKLILAHALSWLSEGKQADAVLCDIPLDPEDDAMSARIAFLRAINRMFALADPDGALETVNGAVSHACTDAFRAVHAAAMGRPREAIDLVTGVADEQLPPLVGAVTVWGHALAAGDAGLVRRAVATCAAGYRLTDSSFDAGQLRYLIADAHVGVLVQAGALSDAAQLASALCAESADRPGAARLMAAAIDGRCALAAGRLDTAVGVLRPSVDALAESRDANGFRYRYQIPLTIALALSGRIGDAAIALEELDEARHPGWRSVDWEHAMASAWVAAQEGAVSEAVRTLLRAAHVAATAGRLAPEVSCLQLAAQFGDKMGADRLVELAPVVEGPRVAAAARFASALRSGDGAELSAASADFEACGDLVAAADAAAHATQAHRRQGLRGSAYAAATRAGALADACCGVVTPALRLVNERVPLTAREREIVLLIAEGLPSRAVADRLTLSVRTIEGHIYRAMNKTGTTSREELAALLSTRRDGPPRDRRRAE